MSDRAESTSDVLLKTFFNSDAGRRTVGERETASTTSMVEEDDVKSNLTLFPGDVVRRDLAEDFFDVTSPEKGNVVVVVVVVREPLSN